MFVDDFASACLFLMGLDKSDYYKYLNNNMTHINVGTGIEISIRDLAYKIAKVVNFKGKINFDNELPDGTPRKLLDSSILNKLGWNSSFKLDDGLKLTYESYLKEMLTN